MVNSEPRTTNWLTSILHFHFHAVFLSFSLLSSMKLYNVASLKAFLRITPPAHSHPENPIQSNIYTWSWLWFTEKRLNSSISYTAMTIGIPTEWFLIHCLIIDAVKLDFLKHNINKTSADTFYVSPYFDFPFVDCQTSKNNKQRSLCFVSIPTWKLSICLINIRTNV